MRILVAEDDQELAEAVAVGLRRAQMAVDVAYDGHTALDRVAVTTYDVVVLDRDLSGVHGDEVCVRLLQAGGTTPILMLTAAATIEARVDGLGLGAGDVVVDTSQRTAWRGGRRLELGPKELAVLQHLLVARPRVVSAEELLERVWDARPPTRSPRRSR